MNIAEGILKEYRFCLISDFHLGDYRIHAHGVGHSNERLAKHWLNLIGEESPAFILFCGDGNSVAPFYRVTYRRMKRLLDDWTTCPVHMVPGNHDGQSVKIGPWVVIDGWDYWRRNLGPLYHSFNLGSDHYIGLNSFDWSVSKRNLLSSPRILLIQFILGARIGGEQFQWLESDLKEARDRDDNIFIFMHHSPLKKEFIRPNGKRLAGGWDEPSRERLLGLLTKYGAKAVFSGHQHYTHDSEWNGIRFFTTASAASMHEKGHDWGYHEVTIRDGELARIEKREFSS